MELGIVEQSRWHLLYEKTRQVPFNFLIQSIIDFNQISSSYAVIM